MKAYVLNTSINELAMFDAYMGFDRIELEKLHKDLQKIFVKLGKKG